MLNDHGDLYQELEDTYRRMFGFIPGHLGGLSRTIMNYIRLTDRFNSIGGPSTRLPAMRRRYRNLLAVCLRYAFVARFLRIPVEFRLRFHYTITGPVSHFERRRVRIQGRWRTRTEMRPQVRGQVSRAHLVVHLPEDRERVFNSIVQAMLEDPRFRGDPNDFPLNDVIRRPGS
jgi:hypothetical protein